MKPVDVKLNTYMDSSKEIISNFPKFKIGDTVRRSKYKNIFTKFYTLNWSEEVFMIKNVKIQCRGYMFFMILTGKKLLESFMKKKCKKQSKKSLELKE